MELNKADFIDEGYDIEQDEYNFDDKADETLYMLVHNINDSYEYKRRILLELYNEDSDWRNLSNLLVARFYLTDYKNNFSIEHVTKIDDDNYKVTKEYPSEKYTFMYLYSLFMDYSGKVYDKYVKNEIKDDLKYPELPYKYPNYRLFNYEEFLCIFDEKLYDTFVYRQKFDNNKDGLRAMYNILANKEFDDGEKQLYVHGLQNKLYKMNMVKPKPAHKLKPKQEPKQKAEIEQKPESKPKAEQKQESKKSNIKNKSKVLKKIFNKR
jgi:hypothetical protein